MASHPDQDVPPRRTGLRVGAWAALATLLIIAAGLAIAWFNRVEIADNFISDELAKRGIPASYEVESIGGRRQVLSNLVVGDPDSPDLTVERAEVFIRYGFGFPEVAEIRLLRPRLYASYRDGKLSFGALDPLIFTGEEAPFEFPDLRLRIDDGRGRLDGDHGAIGIKLAGSGHLRGGFVGEFAAVSPALALGGCETQRTTLYGRVSIDNARPAFSGPLRIAGLACPDTGIAIEGAAVQIDGRADRLLASFEGEAGIRTGALALGDAELASVAGTVRASWRDGALTGSYRGEGTGLVAPQATVARVVLDGAVRTRNGIERVEVDARIDGQGVRPGAAVDRALADSSRAAADTLFAPVLERIRRQLASEGRASRLIAEATLRMGEGRATIFVPQATWRGGSGATLLSLSRAQFAASGPAAPRFSGSFATGGEGLPRITGRVDQRPAGGLGVSISMAPYEAGNASVALPRLEAVQGRNGAFAFSGNARLSGALPGGRADGLVLPLSGTWSQAGGLAMWTACTRLGFDRLQLANLALERRDLTLCPPSSGAILRYDARGLRIAAGAPSLDVNGRLGETPIAIRSGAIGFAYPGAVSARRLFVTLGPGDTASTFSIEELNARIGEGLEGRFAGTDVRLNAVPLDVLGAGGAWRYADGRLLLSDGEFRLADRSEPARFRPLVSTGASLALEDNRITARALLRESRSGRAVSRVELLHDLSTGRGHADLAVDGLVFDEGLQPEALSELAFGVIANARGTITGSGRIDWTEEAVTSSGRFSTDSLDFAAAFGPVQGASGTIEFSDLLGLTTAPGQRLRVRSLNPGVEVTEGEIAIGLDNGEVLSLAGTWPFLGGTLTLHPVEVNIGASEERRYVLEVVGLDAGRFVEYMELENMSATGTFDGTVPLVFDEIGNGHVIGGLLLSRPPGGNVSYVGQLTYEDLGAIANFAFDALRSLDYRQMRIMLDGDLTGEIVTRVRIDGVSQGATAEKNFLTRRIAALPIRVDVNVRAPFYSLLGSIKALYDPSAIRDPRELGLIDEQGNVLRRETEGPPPEPVAPEDLIPAEPVIQRRESEETP